VADSRIRLAADTGGTFTDLIVEVVGQTARVYKRSTTPSEPVSGVFVALAAAAEDLSTSLTDLLGRTDLFVFGTTRATNAIVTGSTAKTALLVTHGHPDILLFREGGGRRTLFDYSQEYPRPYIPRSHTFEIKERIVASGEVLVPLNEEHAVMILHEIRDRQFEALAVSLLWSPINDSHEVRLGELISKHLSDMPYTLSSHLNPSIREYRRTSSAAIDASLKPLMSKFFNDLDCQLRESGFEGRLLIMTSAGGVLDASAVARTPIHSIGSGPAGAPVAGRHFASMESSARNAIVTDAGGTTFDVGLLRDGVIPTTRETMVGDPIAGYITGFPSVDVRSIGAGGGSIAWVDEGGLLHVGPQSAGADPGPACYGRGGDQPTVTDACLVLGYIDPDYFLGGMISVQIELAERAIGVHVAKKLKLELIDAASAILELAIERMVTAIEQLTLNQGIDPEQSLLIGGGGGAGLYCCGIANRLNCWPVLIPEASAALSATGAILSDLQSTYLITDLLTTGQFDYGRANDVLVRLEDQCKKFICGPGAGCISSEINFFVEARYPHQVWEIEVPLSFSRFSGQEDVNTVKENFHAAHHKLFAVKDIDSEVEILSWGASVRCALRGQEKMESPSASGKASSVRTRRAYFRGHGMVETPVLQIGDLETGVIHRGPVLLESPVTTLVANPGTEIMRTEHGSIMMNTIAASEKG